MGPRLKKVLGLVLCLAMMLSIMVVGAAIDFADDYVVIGVNGKDIKGESGKLKVADSTTEGEGQKVQTVYTNNAITRGQNSSKFSAQIVDVPRPLVVQ